ncbi:NUDIX domain-containing protein [Micromonosporaceae bacterium Da 78-11]
MSEIIAAAWVQVRDRRVLVVRATGSDAFYLPGGKPEPGETYAESAAREVGEEVGIVLDPADLTLFTEIVAPAHNRPPGTQVRLICFVSCRPHDANAAPANARPVNAGPEDAGPEDVGSEDVGSEDVGSEDVGSEDVGSEDVGPEDAGDGTAGAGTADDGAAGSRAASHWAAGTGTGVEPVPANEIAELDWFTSAQAARCAPAIQLLLAELVVAGLID